MGIGNTTAAAAIAAALFGGGGERWAGRGTGVDDAGWPASATSSTARSRATPRCSHDPLRIAAAFGGRELAAILGATLAARRHNIPVLLDGFVCTAAVAPLYKLAHRHARPRPRRPCLRRGRPPRAARRVELKPLLDLGMRLGEASGAAMALLILRAALACHTGMATFADAGVSDKPADESAEPKAAG